MTDELILALDQSTSGTKAMLVDKKGNILCNRRRAHKQYYPYPGWVEHDPDEIYRITVEVLREIVAATKEDSNAIKVLALQIKGKQSFCGNERQVSPYIPLLYGSAEGLLIFVKI